MKKKIFIVLFLASIFAAEKPAINEVSCDLVKDEVVDLNLAPALAFRVNDENDDTEIPIVFSSSSSSSSSSGSGGPSEINIGTSLPYAINYSGTDLLKHVKKGDIFYDSTGADLLVMRTGHAAIVEGIFYDETYQQEYIRTIEANPSVHVARGVLSPSRFFKADNSILRVPSASSQQIDNAVSFAISQLGKKYDMYDIFPGDKKWCNDNTIDDWYCSELVWAAYIRQGIGLDIDQNYDGGNAIWPDELYKSPLTNTIMKNGLNTTVTAYNNQLHSINCDGYATFEKHEYIIDNNRSIVCKHCRMNNPNQYYVSESIFPSDYDFEEEYFFYQKNKNISYFNDEYVVQTRRLRTGYISDEYLTLSAKREGAGTAYLEYYFTDRVIDSINIQLALWSATESLKLNSSIRFEVYSNANWKTIHTFNYDQLSKDKDALITYNFDLLYLISAFRIIVETNAVYNDNNRGRVVIGEVGFTGAYL
jgi:uncharacterized protein YycO